MSIDHPYRTPCPPHQAPDETPGKVIFARVVVAFLLGHIAGELLVALGATTP